MAFDRLGKKRANRTRTWASVCIGLFGGERVADERADADSSDRTS